MPLARGSISLRRRALSPRSRTPHGLTPRELEILAYLAAGRTNREIADALFISPRTAGVHVSRILAKLGASTRGEAAAAGRLAGIDRRFAAGGPAQAINGMISRATMFATLIIGLMAGPAVSLNGSPTVSPVTDAA